MPHLDREAAHRVKELPESSIHLPTVSRFSNASLSLSPSGRTHVLASDEHVIGLVARVRHAKVALVVRLLLLLLLLVVVVLAGLMMVRRVGNRMGQESILIKVGCVHVVTTVGPNERRDRGAPIDRWVSLVGRGDSQ